MLVPISNSPRDYDWGSTTLLAAFEGREPTGLPEAEVWFGDHPGSPARTEDGRPLGEVLSEPLPYLLKLLAAGAPLSIQAHPSKDQARAGFALEEEAGVPRDAGHRRYRDDNHKPEIVVALSESFHALSGFRPVDRSLRLLEDIGPATAPVRERLTAADGEAALRSVVAWLLSGEAGDAVREVVAALATAESSEFPAELDAARRIARHHPEDPGVIVALLLNLVVLARGQALFTPAGVPHAYLEGLSVELMAASDNVLRGGLTPKHVDVDELLSILDARPAEPQLLNPVAEGETRVFAVPGLDDFVLRLVRPGAGVETTVAVDGATIALCTAGEPVLRQGERSCALRPGGACLVTPEGGELRAEGPGELYLASPGHAR